MNPNLVLRRAAGLVAVVAAAGLAACGGGGGGGGAPEPAATAAVPAVVPAAAMPRTTAADAVRLAAQASFGATEALVEEIRTLGAEAWIAAQLRATGSRYTSGGDGSLHRAGGENLCALPGEAGGRCWRENLSTQPLVRDFYRNALSQPDQLRQRVAFALQQIVVVSNLEVDGTYGFRRWHNALLDLAFANWRDVLRHAILSPLMGDYLGHVNNHRLAPNENFARELMQLFSIGTCRLGADGRPEGGRCTPNYDNETVRAYAYALTGWTYPAGGSAAVGCWPAGANCRWFDGEMVPLPAFHDTAARRLLSGVTVPAGSDPATAVERVLDSLMAHPSMGPFIGRQLIQHLVTSNPSPAYVARVATAFDAGRHAAGGQTFGSGRKGDLAATVAAILLDAEARQAEPGRDFGRLREPVLLFTAVLRALDGTTDGEPFGFWIGGDLRQTVFRPPSVFSFFLPDQPLPGTSLVAPAFGIHQTNTALARMNFLGWLIDRGGLVPAPSQTDLQPTRVDLGRFAADGADAGALVDRLSLLATGGVLPEAARAKVVAAVTTAGASASDADAAAARLARARTAAYLVFASPQFQVQR